MIAALADVHSPRYLELFWSALQINEPELLLLAGDICEAWQKEQYKVVLKFIEKTGWSCPIIACFGNTEFEQDYEEIKSICDDKIKFLTDQSAVVKISGKKIGIIGTKGCLDQPTSWQTRNIPNIKEIYAKREENIKKLLEELNTEIKILLMHYAPTYKTLEGEQLFAYSRLGCKKLEQVIADTKPTLVMHGHAHNGIPLAFIDSVPVFNVSLPINKEIVQIDLDNLPKAGLMKFV